MFCVKNLSFLCPELLLELRVAEIVVIQDSEDGKRTACIKMR